jgi:hypothetical protein
MVRERANKAYSAGFDACFVLEVLKPVSASDSQIASTLRRGVQTCMCRESSVCSRRTLRPQWLLVTAIPLYCAERMSLQERAHGTCAALCQRLRL